LKDFNFFKHGSTLIQIIESDGAQTTTIELKLIIGLIVKSN